MKRAIIGAAIAAAAITSFVAFPGDAPDRPAGVSARDWIPISDSFGIVLAQTPAPVTGSGSAMESLKGPDGVILLPRGGAVDMRPSNTLLLRPPVSGYFMVKGADGWTRLVVVEPVKGPGDAG
ncbi:MAG TPA: hypothetical protein VNQ32_13845 [Steroidobacteraceae bacterium]|nr:hypothetical protein [Steroidobacteraceae bacterium]